MGNSSSLYVHPGLISIQEVIKGEKLEASDWTADPEDDSSLNQEQFEINKEMISLV